MVCRGAGSGRTEAKMETLTLLAIRVRTAMALGLVNLSRVAVYRLGLRSGTHPVRRLRAQLPPTPYFGPPDSLEPDLRAPEAWWRQARYFGWWRLETDGAPPDWHLNPMTGRRVKGPDREWWRIPDFDPDVGDIKTVWEASRMDWVLAFAQRAKTGDSGALVRLNGWIGDWCGRNPAYRGPNWKCGQEASIRVMNLAMAALVLGQAKASPGGLLDLVEVHIRRILPTLPYAMAQDNNHGTSEAAALFIGGSWLNLRGRPYAAAWERAGRRLLEERSRRLVESDGSFSQYSLNYHRVLLDTFSIVEAWRLHIDRPSFSSEWMVRAKAAARWLQALVDPGTGDGPNLGSNDGARLLSLTDTEYRDFRPSVQLATALFSGKRAYAADGHWNESLRWIDFPVPREAEAMPGSRDFDKGGYAVLRRDRVMAMLRYPRFRFRPSQADALHLDLWVDGENHLRDAGTYSYNTDPEWLGYFPGTGSHNTIQFDGRDQMPRLGRFLFGDWLKANVRTPLSASEQGISFGAGYRDGKGASHEREILLRKDGLTVRDRIAGSFGIAIMRWRLKPGAWRLDGRGVTDGRNRLTVNASMPILRFALASGWESRYYMMKEQLQVLEVEVGEAGTLVTEYAWQP